MNYTDWTIDLVNGESVKRSSFKADDMVQLHILDYGVMVRTLYPTRETTYPWHAIAKLSTSSA